MSRPRVLLADDHRLVSEGLKSLLTEDFDIVGMVEDGRALVASAKELHPDVIVADISMPHLNGIEAIAQLKKNNASVKVILLTMHQDPAYARRALEAGAVGFVVKHSAPAEIVMAIHAALKGQTFITPALASDVLRQAAHGSEGAREDAGHLDSAPAGDSGAAGGRVFSQGNCRKAFDFAAYGRVSQISDDGNARASQQCRAYSFRHQAWCRFNLNCDKRIIVNAIVRP